MRTQSKSYSSFIYSSILLAIIISTSFRRNPECSLLPDGQYRLQYIFNSYEKESILDIRKGRFKKCCVLGDTVKGSLTWIYDCYLSLKADGEQPDTAATFQKLMYRSFGAPCIELESASNDTVYFRTTYSNNVHITVNKGRFIRLHRE